MAAVSPLQELCNETTCSICLEYFTDPVTVECGHNFCRACLVQHWATARPEVLCPQCREPVQKKAFRLNWQLANLVEIVKKLEEEKAAQGTKRECKRHQKPLNFFCKYDESLICVGCTEHRDHAVVPLEEAVQKYKVGNQHNTRGRGWQLALNSRGNHEASQRGKEEVKKLKEPKWAL